MYSAFGGLGTAMAVISILVFQASCASAQVAPATSAQPASFAGAQPTSFAGAQRPFILVTDVDDTIKVSHIDSTVNKVIRFFSEPKAFVGMSELYQAMLDEARTRGLRTKFVVLSGTPTFFESSVLEFLESFDFPPGHIITRPILNDTEQYKTSVVSTIVSHPVMKNAAIVLIGDDTEHDVAAYSKAIVTASAPTLENQIYIRRVKGTAKSTEKSGTKIVAFDSAADIAMMEHLSGRLSRAATEQIFSLVESEREPDHLFVPGEYCARKSSPRLSKELKGTAVPIDMIDRLVRIEDHLRERCASR